MGMDLSISIPSDEFKMVFSFQINLGYMALFKKNEVDGTLQMLD